MGSSARLWLITGASSGLGLELAKIAAAKGDRVIGTSRDPRKVQSLNIAGVMAAKLDHNEPLPQVQAQVDDILAAHGTPDIVVNNAAYVQTGTVEEVSPEETQRQFNTNVFGPINVYRALLPAMRARGSGTLVSVGSMAAWYPMPSCNLYNASKAALRMMVIGMADEVRSFGIRHCLVEPGFFRTDLLKPGNNMTGTTPKSRLPAYAEVNSTADANFAAFHGNQAGDPVRGATVMYDVFTSGDLPGFLPLGSDATTEIRKSAQQTLDDVNKWEDISAKSDFPKDQ